MLAFHDGCIILLKIRLHLDSPLGSKKFELKFKRTEHNKWRVWGSRPYVICTFSSRFM